MAKHRADSETRRHYVPSRSGSLQLKPKLLYTGHLDGSAAWSEEPHSHDFCEIIFIRRGKCRLYLSDCPPVLAESGDVFVYNPGVVHSEVSDGDNPCEMLFFAVTGFQLDGFKRDCLLAEGTPPILHTGGNFGTFDRMFTLLADESQSGQPFCDKTGTYLARTILYALMRIITYGNEEYLKVNASFQNAKKYIDDNYPQIESLDNICKSLYISKYYLSHLFKEYSGMSPLKYLISKRMEHAEKLLSETDLKVNDIAARCGYAETGSFLKTFKSVEGMTPVEFRTRAKHNAGKTV